MSCVKICVLWFHKTTSFFQHLFVSAHLLRLLEKILDTWNNMSLAVTAPRDRLHMYCDTKFGISGCILLHFPFPNLRGKPGPTIFLRLCQHLSIFSEYRPGWSLGRFFVFDLFWPIPYFGDSHWCVSILKVWPQIPRPYFHRRKWYFHDDFHVESLSRDDCREFLGVTLWLAACPRQTPEQTERMPLPIVEQMSETTVCVKLWSVCAWLDISYVPRIFRVQHDKTTEKINLDSSSPGTRGLLRWSNVFPSRSMAPSTCKVT